MPTLQSLLSGSPYVLIDGAMGTMLFAAGLQHGDPPEMWNLEHPDRVEEVARAAESANAEGSWDPSKGLSVSRSQEFLDKLHSDHVFVADGAKPAAEASVGRPQQVGART